MICLLIFPEASCNTDTSIPLDCKSQVLEQLCCRLDWLQSRLLLWSLEIGSLKGEFVGGFI